MIVATKDNQNVIAMYINLYNRVHIHMYDIKTTVCDSASLVFQIATLSFCLTTCAFHLDAVPVTLIEHHTISDSFFVYCQIVVRIM